MGLVGWLVGHYSGGVGGHRQETKRVSFFLSIEFSLPYPLLIFRKRNENRYHTILAGNGLCGNEYYFSSFCFPWFVFAAGRSGMGCADIKSG